MLTHFYTENKSEYESVIGSVSCVPPKLELDLIDSDSDAAYKIWFLSNLVIIESRFQF